MLMAATPSSRAASLTIAPGASAALTPTARTSPQSAANFSRRRCPGCTTLKLPDTKVMRRPARVSSRNASRACWDSGCTLPSADRRIDHDQRTARAALFQIVERRVDLVKRVAAGKQLFERQLARAVELGKARNIAIRIAAAAPAAGDLPAGNEIVRIERNMLAARRMRGA